jgi:hypothetical protein
VCDELIPLRLLAAHADLESQRVEEIIKQVGSTDFMFDEPEDGCVNIITLRAVKIERFR